MSYIDNVPCSCGTGECFKHGRSMIKAPKDKVLMSEPLIVDFINTSRENLEVQDIWHFIMKSMLHQNVGGSTIYLEPCSELPEGAIVVTTGHWDQEQVKRALLKRLLAEAHPTESR